MKAGDVVLTYLGRDSKRHKVTATVKKVNLRTVWVKLKDGSIIKRKLDRDVVSQCKVKKEKSDYAPVQRS